MKQRLSIGDLKGIAAAWSAAGMDASVIDPIVFAAVKRHEQLVEELNAISGDREPALQAIKRRVVAGELTLVAALEAENAVRDVHRARELVSVVGTMIEGRARDQLHELGDALITEHLQPRHDALHEEAADLAYLVEGVVNDEQAVRAPAKNRDAWSRLAAIREELAALRDLLVKLRSRGVVPTIERKPDEDGKTFTYRYPERAPRDFAPDDQHPTRRFVARLRSGADPLMLTARQAVRLRQQRRDGRVSPDEHPHPHDDVTADVSA